MQDAAPAAEYIPTIQSLQLLEPVPGAYVPFRQPQQSEDPVVPRKWPEAQLVHIGALPVAYLPASQLVHIRDPSIAKAPGAQLKQLDDDDAPKVAENRPAAHAKQLKDDGLARYVPVPQVTQAVRVDVEYAPTGHEVHIEAPEEAAYVPARQAAQLDEVDAPAVDA